MLITINPNNLLLNRDPWPQGLNPKCLNSEATFRRAVRAVDSELVLRKP